eukprot:Pgem_evm1s12975
MLKNVVDIVFRYNNNVKAKSVSITNEESQFYECITINLCSKNEKDEVFRLLRSVIPTLAPSSTTNLKFIHTLFKTLVINERDQVYLKFAIDITYQVLVSRSGCNNFSFMEMENLIFEWSKLILYVIKADYNRTYFPKNNDENLADIVKTFTKNNY